jgi:transcriptional regulator with XRE-family HTH domain
MRVREVGKFIRDQRRATSLSLRKLSSLAGVSNPYLSQIERGLRRPSADILQAIAKALSISAETLYIKAGILDERTDGVDVVGTIRRDVAVSEKQKQILIDLYQSFRSPVPASAMPRRAVAAKASRPETKSRARTTKSKTRTAKSATRSAKPKARPKAKTRRTARRTTR